MSQEEANRFAEKLSSDTEFRERVNAFLQGEGFLCTFQEVLNFMIEQEKKGRVNEHKHCHYFSNLMKDKISPYVSRPHGYENWTG